MRAPLTEAQTRTLAAIVAFISARGYPPTRREVADALGHASVNSAVGHVDKLREKGWIEIDHGRSRGIRVL